MEGLFSQHGLNLASMIRPIAIFKNFSGESLDVHLCFIFRGLWILAGDFNATCKVNERSGYATPRKVSKAFVSFIHESQLMDHPLKGQCYTWSNRRESPILANINRFLLSYEMDDLCPHSCQEALPNPCSDHVPIKLSLLGLRKPKGVFKFNRS